MKSAPRQVLLLVTIGLLAFGSMPNTWAAPSAAARVTAGGPAEGLRIRDELGDGDEVPVVNERRRRRLHVEDENGTIVEATAWRTDNPDVATVTRKGVVRGRRYGFVTITAETAAGEVRADVVVVRVTSQGSAPVRGEARSDLGGAIYLSSPESHVIYRSDGTRDKVFVGQVDEPGFVDGTGENARLRIPAGLGIDQRAEGGIYVAEVGNHCIRRVTPAGRTSVAIGMPTVPGRSLEVSDEEPAVSARLSSPAGVAVRGSEIVVADSDNHSLVYYSPSAGLVRLLGGQPGEAGNRDGAGREARFRTPTGLAIATDGALLAVADTGNDTVRLVRLLDGGNGRIRGIVSTLGRATSGKGRLPAGAPDGDAFTFEDPRAVAFDGIGSICVVDALGASVVTRPDGRLPSRLKLAESGSLGRPVAVTVQGTRVLVLDGDARGRNEAVRVVEVGPPTIATAMPDVFELEGGEEVVVEGTNFAPESVVTMGDGVVEDLVIERSTRLRFRVPETRAPGTRTLTIATRGGVAQHSVTVRPPSTESLGPGELTAILGGGLPEIGDGGLLESPAAVIRGAADLVADSAGNLFVGDENRVRRIDVATGIITTVAGNGIREYSGDGGPAVAAGLLGALDLAIVGGSLVIKSGYSTDGTQVTQLRRVAFDSGLISAIPLPESTDTLGSIVATPSGQLLASYSSPEGATIESIDPETGVRTVVWTRSESDVPLVEMVAASDTVLFTGAGNKGVWRIDLETGEARRVAGGGETALSYEPAAALDARIQTLSDIALAPDGSVLLSATTNLSNVRYIARIDLDASTIVAIAGGGTQPVSEVPVSCRRVAIGEGPILADGSGRLLARVSGAGIVSIDDGRIRSLGGAQPAESPVVPDGDASRVSRIDTDSIAILGDGRIVFSEDREVAARIRVFDPAAGTIETIAGNGVDSEMRAGHDGMPALDVPLGINIVDIAVGPDGSLYVAVDFRIVRISGGRAFIHAGNRRIAPTVEGPAREVAVEASAIAVAPDGTVYFGDDTSTEGEAFVWRVRDGRVERVAGGALGTCPASGPLDDLRLETVDGLAFSPSGVLLVADAKNAVVHRIDLADGTYRREAGTGVGGQGCGLSEECPAPLMDLHGPMGVAFDSFGHPYVWDETWGVLRIGTDGLVHPVTSLNDGRFDTGNRWDYGRPGVEYRVSLRDIAVDPAGNLVISDSVRRGLLFVRAPADNRGTH